MNAKYEILDPRLELPAGTYWVGDPCYVLPDDEWSDALDATRYFNIYRDDSQTDYVPTKDLMNGVFARNGVLFAVSSTAYGDGEYPAVDERHHTLGTCGVDAGCIAAIPLDMIDIDAVNADYSQGLDGLGFLCDMDDPFTVEYSNGLIRFGAVVVRTGD